MKDFVTTTQFRLDLAAKTQNISEISFHCDWEIFKRAHNYCRGRRITSNVVLPPAEPQLGESCPLEHVHMFGREQNPSPQEFLQIAGGRIGHSD